MSDGVALTAICDSEILGSVLEEGNLGIKVSESFYKGELIDADKAGKVLQSRIDLNLVGNNIVNLALKLNVIDSSSVLKIGGVLHAEVMHCDDR